MNQPNSRINGADEMFCPSCGEIIKKAALFCVHYAVPTGIVIDDVESDKNNTAAVLLAFFFHYFGWLYTGKKDWKKFLVCLLLQFIAIFWYVVASINSSDYQRFVSEGREDADASGIYTSSNSCSYTICNLALACDYGLSPQTRFLH